MDLLPDEQKVLDCLAGDLGTQEPKLTSMFGIFTRLTAPDGRPPEEDALLPPRRPPPGGGPAGTASARRAHRLSLWLAAAYARRRLVIAVGLTALLAVIVIASLAGLP
jgi:hypothetical protein